MGETTATRSMIFQQFIADHKALREKELTCRQFEAYMRGQKVNANEATYQELMALYQKFLIFQLYG